MIYKLTSEVVHFRIYTTGPAILPILEIPLKPTLFGIACRTVSHFFLNFGGILKRTPSYLRFNPRGREEIISYQIRRGRKVEYHSGGYIVRKLPLVSIRGTDFAEMRLMFKSSLGIHWHVPFERSNLPATSPK